MAQTPAPAAPAVPPAALTGVWVDDKGDGAIEIAPCGSNLCGTIVWLRQPTDSKGRPLIDGNNSDPAKRKRPICGLPVIGDLKPVPGGAWDGGWIYDPKDGKAYDLEIKARAQDKLQVMGYLGTKFLSETFVWTRAPIDIKRCGS